jgi:hypothetical protein
MKELQTKICFSQWGIKVKEEICSKEKRQIYLRKIDFEY